MLEKVSESTWALDRESEREREREVERRREQERERVRERGRRKGGEKLTFLGFMGSRVFVPEMLRPIFEKTFQLFLQQIFFALF